MWEKEEVIKLSGKKRKRRSIRMKVYLYEFFISYIIYCLLFYYVSILTTPSPPPDLWYLSHQGKEVQELLAKRIRVIRRQGYR